MILKMKFGCEKSQFANCPPPPPIHLCNGEYIRNATIAYDYTFLKTMNDFVIIWATMHAS